MSLIKGITCEDYFVPGSDSVMTRIGVVIDGVDGHPFLKLAQPFNHDALAKGLRELADHIERVCSSIQMASR